jgi:hypothetical protein
MKAIRLLTLVLISSITILSCNGQANQLPKSTGKYFIGVAYLSLIDSSRRELFDNSNTASKIRVHQHHLNYKKSMVIM